jgi:hypothetical protein
MELDGGPGGPTRVLARWMTCGLMRALGQRRMGRWHRAGEAARAEEDGLVMPRRGGSQGRGGRAVVAGVGSRQVMVGRRQEASGVGSNRPVAVGRRQATVGVRSSRSAAGGRLLASGAVEWRWSSAGGWLLAKEVGEASFGALTGKIRRAGRVGWRWQRQI